MPQFISCNQVTRTCYTSNSGGLLGTGKPQHGDVQRPRSVGNTTGQGLGGGFGESAVVPGGKVQMD